MGFGQNPYQAIVETVLLKFRPVNLDVLPLYIVPAGRLSSRLCRRCCAGRSR